MNSYLNPHGFHCCRPLVLHPDKHWRLRVPRYVARGRRVHPIRPLILRCAEQPPRRRPPLPRALFCLMSACANFKAGDRRRKCPQAHVFAESRTHLFFRTLQECLYFLTNTLAIYWILAWQPLSVCFLCLLKVRLFGFNVRCCARARTVVTSSPRAGPSTMQLQLGVIFDSSCATAAQAATVEHESDRP
jgi:hypothetical protein